MKKFEQFYGDYSGAMNNAVNKLGRKYKAIIDKEDLHALAVIRLMENYKEGKFKCIENISSHVYMSTFSYLQNEIVKEIRKIYKLPAMLNKEDVLSFKFDKQACNIARLDNTIDGTENTFYDVIEGNNDEPKVHYDELFDFLYSQIGNSKYLDYFLYQLEHNITITETCKLFNLDRAKYGMAITSYRKKLKNYKKDILDFIY